MPVNYNVIMVFDFETGSKYPDTCEVLEIGAKAYHARTLEPYDNGEFSSLIKPINEDNLDPDAMRIHKIPIEELRKAPDLKAVWLNFHKFVNRFNFKKNDYDCPIAAGKSIRGFDLPIISRLNKQFTADARLFSTFWFLDLDFLLWPWFESNQALKNYKMDELRSFFGLDDTGGGSWAHRALFDVKQEGELLVKILKLHRNLLNVKTTTGSPMINFNRAKVKAA